MALRQAVCFSLAALSLLLQSVSSFSGSGGQEYLVAPELKDCPVNTNCDTLSSYSAKGLTQVGDVIFSFLPGLHNLSQTWTITACSNVTIRGAGYSAVEDNDISYGFDVVCESNFSSNFLHSPALQVIDSKQIVVEGIRIADCPSSIYLEENNGISILNVNIICSFDIHTHNLGLSASQCGDIAIKQSIFTNCIEAIDLQDIRCGIIYGTATVRNDYGLCLTGYIDLEVSNSYFMNSNNIQVHVSQGIITFQKISSQGSFSPLEIHVHAVTDYVQQTTPTQVNIFNSTITMEGESEFGILLNTDVQIVDINLQSVLVTGASHSRPNGIIILNNPDAGSLVESWSVQMGNVIIENINLDFTGHAVSFTPAALYVFSSKNLTISDCTIKNNGVTGIVLVDSTAFLQGSITLTNNSGINGGGIALFSMSFIVLDSSTELQLFNNTAETFGGGIYVSQDLVLLLTADGVSVTPIIYCFARSVSERLKPIVFDGNMAKRGGYLLYGGYVDSCVQLPSNNQSIENLFIPGLYGVGFCNQTLISSDPIKLLPCNEYCVDDSEDSTKYYSYALFPGQEFSLSIAAVGQLNGLTPAIILFSSNDIILEEISPDTSQSFDTQSIDAKCTIVTRILVLREYIKETFVYFTIADDSLPNYVNITIELYIEVLQCPPGFNLSDGVCGCTNSIQELATCNITSESIQRKGNSWIYPRNDSIMIFNNCPFDYCNNIAFPSGNPDEQCDHNRSGILCGQCIPGYSLMLGSNECQNCTEQIWKVPLIVLGAVLAGIGLVAALIAINLTVSVGAMNGLIFCVNIVKVYEPIFLSDTFHPILRCFISWLNLDLGITTCFIPEMTACVKVGLQFAFPLYLLSIFLFIIVICKAGQWPVLSSSRFIRSVSGKVTLLIGSKAVPVLATLLLLSYTKLLRTTVLIFHDATIITKDCDKNTSTCKNFDVWYVDGNTNYTSRCHGILFGVAVGIFSSMVVLFTSFLLFFPLMERYLPRFKCWSSWHMRLKPWYDAYGGPYKDEYRSWTGMLLLVRCFLALVVAFENDPLVNLSVLAWTCLFLISLLSLIQVYKSSFFNSLESLYLASLLLMVFLSTTARQINAVLSVVLCSFLLLISYHVYHQLVKLKRIQRLMNKVKRKIKNFGNNFKEETINHNCDANDSMDSCTLVTMKSVNYTELREPLLEEEL